MASNPQDPSFYDFVREPDPLLRAAAESLYEREGNPFSNPEPVKNTAHWRKHEAVDFGHSAIAKLVDLMVSEDYVVKDSSYAEHRRLVPGLGLKIWPEEKIQFHQLLSRVLGSEIFPQAQEAVLLGNYRQALKAQSHDLSPTRAVELEDVNKAITARCDAIAAQLGDKLERFNERAFPDLPERRPGRE